LLKLTKKIYLLLTKIIIYLKHLKSNINLNSEFMKKIAILLAMVLFAGLQVMWAQSTITGTVKDTEGAALPGATVRAQGFSGVGTVTDMDGKYSLQVPEGATTLVFSFVGMKENVQTINGRTTIDVTLAAADITVDEVIVTGYGIKREKRTVTYQTGLVSGDDLNKAQSTRATEGLVGKVAGLQINTQDNGVNPNSQILLRGLRSISKSNEALIVIDGAIANSGALNSLNSNDIQSISVLKGASSAAIYGSRAANGAIIVQTKTGNKNDRFTVGVNSATSFEQVSYMPDFQTEHGTGWDGVYSNLENTNWGPRFDGQLRQIGPTFPDGYVLKTQMVPYAPIKDNLKDFFNLGTTLQNTVYMTGGDETGTFYMSLGNQTTNGIVPSDKYDRNTVRVNASKKVGKVKLSVNSSFMQDKTDVVGSSIGSQDRAFYWFLLNTPANIPLTSYSDWDNPKSYGYANNYHNAFYQNPYWAIGTNRNIDYSQRLIANAAASWDILENLNFTGRFGVNANFGNGKNWRAAQEYDEDLMPYMDPVSSFVEDTELKGTRYTGDAILNGNFKFGSDFTLKSILGASVYSYNYRNSIITANNLSIPDFYDISNGTGQYEAAVYDYAKRTVGFFADQTIGYKNWAFLQLTGRYDFTSTLSIGKNGYFYPSVGLSVVLTDAVPVLKSNVLSYAKITASNATVYNDPDIYQINETYTKSGAFPFGNVNGFYKSLTAVDPDIQKEKLNSSELGLNLAFFKSRFTLDLSYFYTLTTNLITNTTPSYASGATAYTTNIGQLHGGGYEATLGGKIISAGDFVWDMSVNYYHYATVVDKIAGDLKEVALDKYTGFGTYAVVGEAFPQLKAVSYTRDDQGRVVVDGNTGNPIAGDVENMGKTTPDYVVGLTSKIGFKGISLSATFDYRGGYVYYSQGSDLMEFTGRSMESVSADRKDFVWPNSVINTGTKDNPNYVENKTVQTTGGIMEFWQTDYNNIKENYVKDATAFKIRELALSYSLPTELLKKTNVLNKLSIGLYARNLFTYLPNEKFRFSDPEFRNTRPGDDPNGIGIGGYLTSPPTRTFGFNVNIEF